MMEIVGLPLSVAAIAIFIVLMLDWRRRRGRFESVHVAGYRIDAGVAQWVWFAVLVGSFAFALWRPGVALATHERHVIEGQRGQASEPAPLVRTAQRLHIGAMLPFYRYGRTVRTTDGTAQSVTITRQLVLPVWFIAGAGLYWLFVLQPSRVASSPAAGQAASRRS